MDMQADEVIEALNRGLVSRDGTREIELAVLQLRLANKEVEITCLKHDLETANEQIASRMAQIRTLELAVQNPKLVDIPETNGHLVSA